VPRRGPQLELGITARPHLQQRIVAAIVKLDVGQALRVAPVEAFGEPQDGGQCFDGLAPLPGQLRVVFVSPLGRRAAMVTRDERHRVDLIGLESPEITILDQIVRVPVMTLVADVRADVVQERRVLEPVTLARAEPVQRPRAVEERQRQTRHLLRMRHPDTTALRQLADRMVAHRLLDEVDVVLGHRPQVPKRLRNRPGSVRV